jgi:hypothetical protein
LVDVISIKELERQMRTSVAMLEQHYSKITPELVAEKFAGPKLGPRRGKASAATAVQPKGKLIQLKRRNAT